MRANLVSTRTKSFHLASMARNPAKPEGKVVTARPYFHHWQEQRANAILPSKELDPLTSVQRPRPRTVSEKGHATDTSDQPRIQTCVWRVTHPMRKRRQQGSKLVSHWHDGPATGFWARTPHGEPVLPAGATLLHIKVNSACVEIRDTALSTHEKTTPLTTSSCPLGRHSQRCHHELSANPEGDDPLYLLYSVRLLSGR